MTEALAMTRITLDPSHRYHFVAIGGIGMSAIAQILLARGFRVSGSDIKDSPMLERLRQLGAEISVGHEAVHVHDGDVVVLSDAIKPENPEWCRAQELSLPVLTRAEVLGCLSNSSRGLAVCGTHGKTTTSGMLAMILLEAGLNPSCLLGGELTSLGGNARVGGDLIVVEACEAYNSFLQLTPEAAIVTNIEVDHLDFHRTPEHLYDSFRQFLRQVRTFAVLNGDDPLLRGMLELPARAVTYGAGDGNDYRFTEVTAGVTPSFTLCRDTTPLGRIVLRIPGTYNVYNATGAAALALELGVELAVIQHALAAFPGMHRRFERIGTLGEVMVVDDYAHHPTEIQATLTAARTAFPGRVVAVFQPHLYSRTRDLLDDFARALALADIILIAPIYPARERPIPGIDHHLLAQRLADTAPAKPVIALQSLEQAVALLTAAAGGVQAEGIAPLKKGDVILTIGAGDVDRVALALRQAAATREESERQTK